MGEELHDGRHGGVPEWQRELSDFALVAERVVQSGAAYSRRSVNKPDLWTATAL